MVEQRRDFSSDLHELAAMRAFLRQACEAVWDAPDDEEAIAQLELALDEAATNVIVHAYEREEGRPIEMVVEAGADRVGVGLYHRGRDFDPAAAPPPSFDGSREGGFGLYLIQQCVDEVRYLRDGRGWSGIQMIKERKGNKEE
jgi:anti-sigma regulatory factor (Ser/Thr protein kinase)